MNHSNTPKTIVFDHIKGEVRYEDQWLTGTFYEEPDPPGPLNRAQYWLWKRQRGGWLGNRISDLRYWLWRLSR